MLKGPRDREIAPLIYMRNQLAEALALLGAHDSDDQTS